jgi:hypothetical protein
VFPCRGLVAPCQRAPASIKGLSLRCQTRRSWEASLEARQRSGLDSGMVGALRARMNIAPTILPKKIEDLRVLGTCCCLDTANQSHVVARSLSHFGNRDHQALEPTSADSSLSAKCPLGVSMDGTNALSRLTDQPALDATTPILQDAMAGIRRPFVSPKPRIAEGRHEHLT